MRILIAGSTGFLGQHLQSQLRQRGHDVVPLVRRPPRAGELSWDPTSGHLDPKTLTGFDAVVNLAGSPTVGNPHSKKWARELEDSRVRSTGVLARAIAATSHTPAYVVGNGISFYGDHGSVRLDESAPSRGDALLTHVTRVWQAAAKEAEDVGARVAYLRTAPVLDATSAPLKQLRLLFKTGLGGRLGSGEQYFPVISLRDWVGAATHVIESGMHGPVNLCAPHVPTNAEFTKELARKVRRPAALPVPAAAVRLAAGPMAPEVLGSIRGVPQALLDDGFVFQDDDVSAILDVALG